MSSSLRPVLDLIGDRVVAAHRRGVRVGLVVGLLAGVTWGVTLAWLFALSFGGWPWT